VASLARPGRRPNPIAIRTQCVSVRRCTLTLSVVRPFDFGLPACHVPPNSVRSEEKRKKNDADGLIIMYVIVGT